LTLGGERGSVQNPMIAYAKEVGWEYLSQDAALGMRNSLTNISFDKLFIEQLKKLNSEFMTDELATEVLNRIKRLSPTIEGNLFTWEYLKGLKTIFVPKENRERNITLIDKENIENNTFHVTDEFKFTNGTKTIKMDIVFLINGLPIVLVETKAAKKIEGLSEALDQVRRYHLDCPEILSILQLYAITHIIRYYYSCTWNSSKKGLFNWKDENGGDFESLVKSFFDKDRIVKVITDFILFTRADDELKKVILRPHQIRAVDRLVQRAEDSKKKRALIWHTQGSGKTYTMIVTAQRLLQNPTLENPTVLMLVDRNELESQLFSNISSVGIENVEIAQTKKHLKSLLSEDRRGLIVSTIHKFDKMDENINTRRNIFVLVDEAHRTTSGTLGNYLMGALSNATYIGFTGTPIDRTAQGKSTFITFGIDDPPKGYLDKYGIGESIQDETTVPLNYTLAPNELLVERETLEKEFLNLKDSKGLSDIEELNKVLERAVNLKNMMKGKDRVKEISKYVSDHFTTYIEPMGYKAFLVAVDREACAMYKEELDKLLPKEYSEVVYSPYYNDPPYMAKYHLDEKEETSIRKNFRASGNLPKILIVTEKLLTGFDAPILYCMYLDKPMRDHVLLQAIARVNRPYEDESGRKKPSGFVLDFVGLFNKLEKALAFDSSDLDGIVNDIEKVKDAFRELMEKSKNEYLVIIEGKSKDKAVEAVLSHFMDEEIRHEFYGSFKSLSAMYEILSPDQFLRPYIEDYETLSSMYSILKDAYEPGISVDKEFYRKTAALVQEHSRSGKIKKILDIYEINENTIKKIEEDTISDREKVYNISKGINELIKKKGATSPYLISIGERVQRLITMYNQGQIDTKDTLDALINRVNEINDSTKADKEKNMSSDIFTLFWMLDRSGIKNAEKKAKEMEEIFEKYPNWKKSEGQEREIVKPKIYKLILSDESKDIKKVTELGNDIIRILKGA